MDIEPRGDDQKVAIDILKLFIGSSTAITADRLAALEHVRFDAADGTRTGMTVAEAIQWSLADMARRLKAKPQLTLKDATMRALIAALPKWSDTVDVHRDEEGRITELVRERVVVS